ncbi:hypothetical protein ABPG72_007569 [Tetrahymena utriculariae]
MIRAFSNIRAISFKQKQFKFDSFKSFHQPIVYRFAHYDPYYILGVDRRAEFSDIKKAYFKLIATYHPDRNPSPDATKKFVLIKDAFEDIKKQLGQEVKMTYESSRSSRSSEFQSVRPDANRYKEDFENEQQSSESGQQQKYGKFDFREYASRTPEGEEFDKFRDSFENIADIEDKSFTPIDADIPDASKRFKLEEKIAKNTFLPEDSKVMFMVLLTIFLAFVVYMSSANSKSVKNKYEVAIYHMLNKDKLQDLEEEYDKHEEVTKNLKMNQQYKEYKQKLEKNLENAESKMLARVPIIREYSSIQETIKSEQGDDEDDEI